MVSLVDENVPTDIPCGWLHVRTNRCIPCGYMYQRISLVDGYTYVPTDVFLVGTCTNGYPLWMATRTYQRMYSLWVHVPTDIPCGWLHVRTPTDVFLVGTCTNGYPLWMATRTYTNGCIPCGYMYQRISLVDGN